MTQFVDVDGIRLHVRLDGPEAAPPLVLANSLGTDLTMWDPQVQALARTHRLIRFDTRGHGKSAVPPGPYAVPALARDVLGLVGRLGYDRVDFCGLSLGGMIGLYLARTAPDRIGRVALCNTAALIGPATVWDTRIKTVNETGMAAIAAGVIDRWFTKGFQERDPAAVARVRDAMLGTDPAGYTAACAAVRDMDQRAGLAEVRCPALVIVGEHDLATTPAQGEELAAGIAGARLVRLDAAHISNIEQPAAFTAAVTEFFGGSTHG
ncbi:MAG: 3-oxoadipate enol-lactonase [Ferrovibrionaceae bacterium]